MVAAGPLLGCSSNGNDDSGGEHTGDAGQANEGDAGVDLGPTGAVDVEPELFPQSVASGDPRPQSVVLWTRSPSDDDLVSLRLQLAKDDSFEELVALQPEAAEVRADVEWDHCVRVRVVDLEPDTTYYYRFLRDTDDGQRASRTGRTKTAPDADSDRAVSFAVMSCQDYSGRYFHTHAHAAEQDIDFVVHVGDYVYETGSDPRFQVENAERAIVFSDPDGAIERSVGEEDGNTGFLAARSLSNYRDLYRTVRTDPHLQQLHERHPMIVTWDDHEFANDAYAQTTTDGEDGLDERDVERRANADQAWFEYMPVDYRDGADFEYDRDAAFPENLRIYRDFRFGRHVHLVMTDLRRFRADHVIPEDAVPGNIAVNQDRLEELLDEVPESAEPYADADHPEVVRVIEGLLDAAEAGADLGVDLGRLSGDVSLSYLNGLIAALEEAGASDLPDPIEITSDFARGISFAQVGKTADYGSFGSRYFVEPEAFRIVALDRYDASGGASEEVMGAEQEAWFIDALRESDATWKLWGNAYTLSTRRIDLSSIILPGGLGRQHQLSADDWDGMPNTRARLLAELADVDNLVALTGDSHSFFASDTGVEGGQRVLEFVCGAMSSATYQAVLGSGANGVPGVELLAPLAGPLISAANPHIAYRNIEDNGFAVVTANEDELRVVFHQIAYDALSSERIEGELDAQFERQMFRVGTGSAAIEQSIDGEYKRWDRDQQRFV